MPLGKDKRNLLKGTELWKQTTQEMRFNCRGCGKRLRDPADNPIYVVRSVEKPSNKKEDSGEYWCSQACMNRHDPTRKEAIRNAREVGQQRNAHISPRLQAGILLSCLGIREQG